MCNQQTLKFTKVWFCRAIMLVIIYTLVSFIPKPRWICDTDHRQGNRISALTSFEALDDNSLENKKTTEPVHDVIDPQANKLLQQFPTYLGERNQVDSERDIAGSSQHLPSKMSLVKIFYLQNFNFSHFGRTWLNKINERDKDFDHQENGIRDQVYQRFSLNKLQQNQKLPDCVPLKVSRAARRTKICVHFSQDDNFISNRLRDTGTWEMELVFQMEEFFMANPRSQLVDLGCNVGVFTLFAASMAKPALAVDILPSNLALIQLSIAVNDESIEKEDTDDEDIRELQQFLGYTKKTFFKYSNLITTIQNAIYSKHAKMYVYLKDDPNLGGTEVKELNTEENAKYFYSNDAVNTKQYSRHKNHTYEQDSPNNETNNKILIDAICLDDLVPYIRANLSVFLKMDIEGSEPDVFLCASNFFMYVDVRVILMEVLFHRYSNQGKKMVSFLLSHNMLPSEDVNGRKLLDTDLNNMYKWPENIFWIKVR